LFIDLKEQSHTPISTGRVDVGVEICRRFCEVSGLVNLISFLDDHKTFSNYKKNKYPVRLLICSLRKGQNVHGDRQRSGMCGPR